MQTKHLGDVQGGQPLASLDHRFGQSLGHPGIAIKPADGLYSLAARPTSDTSQLHIQSHRAAKNRQVTDRTLAVFMDGGNAGLLMCLLARTSSIKPAFLFLSFPGFREEPYFWAL